MSIVLKWNFRTLFSDVPRFILTILSIAGAFAMVTAMGLTVESHMVAIGSMNADDSLPRFVLSLLRPLTLTVFAFTLYVLFAVSLEERKNQYFIMRSSGATTRQLLWGLTIESLVLDVTGAALGVGLGFLIAWDLLKRSGIPLVSTLLWDDSIMLYGILPALMLPPFAMLAASPRLLWQKRITRRKKPNKKAKDPFKRWRFSLLFGTGGALEYTLGKQQRRHRLMLVTAIVANFAALFLVTAGLVILSDMESLVDCDMQIRMNRYYDTDPDNELNTDGARAAIDAVLEECRTEGVVQDRVHIREYLPVSLVIDDDSLSAESLAAYASTGVGDQDTSLHPMNDRQHYNELCALYCFDDTFFYDRFVKEDGVCYSGSGALLYNRVNVMGKPAPLIDDIPENGVTLHAQDWPYTFMTTDKMGWEDDGDGVNVDIGGWLNSWSGDTLLAQFNMLLLNGSVVLPEQLFTQYASAIDSLHADCYEEYYIHAKDTETLYLRLREALDGEYGYTVSRNTLGDGSKSHSNRTDILIRDNRRLQGDFQTFLSQTERLYLFFAVLLFLMIGLNIVNVVHMNRLSRRQEYAILTSLGLSGRQRMGMLLYESFRLTSRVVLSGVAVMVVIARIVYPFYSMKVAYNELMLPASVKTLSGSDYTALNEVLKVAENLWQYISPRWPLIVFAVLFLLGGFVLAEYIALKRLEKDELVLVLKDDMHE
ncbi:MAG: ABC transporter permease [Clostridia bacterium]|nr:ABC transporter permease [Clostridia bacterium]